MDEEQIKKVQEILMNWNPLGDRASEIEDLNDYETEAVDILFHIDKKSSVDRINKMMTTVIYQAFGVYHDLKDTIKYANQIRKTYTK